MRQVFKKARNITNPSWIDYEDVKDEIYELNLNCEEYEVMVRTLAKIFKI
jgi:hypothetical protein